MVKTSPFATANAMGTVEYKIHNTRPRQKMVVLVGLISSFTLLGYSIIYSLFYVIVCNDILLVSSS